MSNPLNFNNSNRSNNSFPSRGQNTGGQRQGRGQPNFVQQKVAGISPHNSLHKTPVTPVPIPIKFNPSVVQINPAQGHDKANTGSDTSPNNELNSLDTVKFYENEAKIHLLKQDPEKARDILRMHSRCVLKEHISHNKRSKEDLNYIQRLKMHAHVDTLFRGLKKEKSRINGFYFHKDLIVCSLSKTNLTSYFEEFNRAIEQKKKIEKNRAIHNTYLNDYEPNPQIDQEGLDIDRKRAQVYENQIQAAKIAAENAWKSHGEGMKKILSSAEIKRQNKVEDIFFDPARTKNPKARAYSKKILNSRYGLEPDSNEEIVFNQTGLSSRAYATAERAIVDYSLKMQERDQEADPDFLYALTPENNNTQCRTHNSTESVVYGDVKVKYTVYKESRSKNHAANCWIEDLGTYMQVAATLNSLLNGDRGKSMAITKLIINLFNSGEPIVPESLAPICKLEPSDPVLSHYSNFLTRLSVNLLREVTRRAAPHEIEHKLPHAVMLARVLILAESGRILLTDLFKEHTLEEYKKSRHPLDEPYGSLFSIFTSKWESPIASNISKVTKKVEFINSFFIECLVKQEESLSRATDLCFATTREGIHGELIEIFGGNEESDGSGYSSDEDYEPFPIEEDPSEV